MDALVVGNVLDFENGRCCGNIIHGSSRTVIGEAVRQTAIAKGCSIIKDDKHIDFAGYVVADGEIEKRRGEKTDGENREGESVIDGCITFRFSFSFTFSALGRT